MTKKSVTQYFMPITPEEREEIQVILKPIKQHERQKEVIKNLYNSIFGLIGEVMKNGAKHYLEDYHPTSEQAITINTRISGILDEWHSTFSDKMDREIRRDELHFSISTDGLFIITISDLLKFILTADYLYMTGLILPPDFLWDAELVTEVNKYLNTEDQE